MKQVWTFLLAGTLGLVACGDDKEPENESDASNAPDTGVPGQDAGQDAAQSNADAAAEGGALDASTDARTPDANPGDASGGDAGPKPIKVSCGANVEPVDCPVCANSAGCATPTYTDNGNGTVTSSCCGLVWEKVQMNVDRTWAQAYEYCANLSLAGGGFRLPTIAELNTLLVSDTWPTVDLTVFPNTPMEPVWSSTEYANDYAWQIEFAEAAVQGGELTNDENVRCVR